MITELEKLRQEDHYFEINLTYIVRPCTKTKQITKQQDQKFRTALMSSSLDAIKARFWELHGIPI